MASSLASFPSNSKAGTRSLSSFRRSSMPLASSAESVRTPRGGESGAGGGGDEADAIEPEKPRRLREESSEFYADEHRAGAPPEAREAEGWQRADEKTERADLRKSRSGRPKRRIALANLETSPNQTVDAMTAHTGGGVYEGSENSTLAGIPPGRNEGSTSHVSMSRASLAPSAASTCGCSTPAAAMMGPVAAFSAPAVSPAERLLRRLIARLPGVEFRAPFVLVVVSLRKKRETGVELVIERVRVTASGTPFVIGIVMPCARRGQSLLIV